MQDQTGPGFLEAETTRPRLVRALAANMQECILRNASIDGANVQTIEGIPAPYLARPKSEAHLFPQLDPQRIDIQLDALLHFYRRCRPLQRVLYWSVDPTEPADLEVRLLARGFQVSWRPHWMWLDFRSLRPPQSLPAGLRIEALDLLPIWDVTELPYYDRKQTAQRWSKGQERMPYVWHFAAWLNDQLVGHSMLNMTTHGPGLAGIFDVGVIPAARRQGIGAALTWAACSFAQQMGCHHAVLNATEMGTSVYQRIGFTSLGYGHTWLLKIRTQTCTPPTSLQIELVQATGRGDIASLHRLEPQLSHSLLTQPLQCGMTLLQLATHFAQPATAAWLYARGAALDLLSAWDLGWRQHVHHLLNTDPSLVNQYIGPHQMTAMHAAVERNDLELAYVLLSAHPNLSIEDGQFHSTAPGWARHLQRQVFISLFEQYQQ